MIRITIAILTFLGSWGELFGQSYFEQIDRNLMIGDKWTVKVDMFTPNSLDSLAKPRLSSEYILEIEVIDTARTNDGRKMYDIKYSPNRIFKFHSERSLLKKYEEDSIRLGFISREYENGEPVSATYIRIDKNNKVVESDIEKRKEPFRKVDAPEFPPFWLPEDYPFDYFKLMPCTWLSSPSDGSQIIRRGLRPSFAIIEEKERKDTIERKLKYFRRENPKDQHQMTELKFVKDSPWWVSYIWRPSYSKVPVMRATVIKAALQPRTESH